MKLKFKTEAWETKDPETWINRYTTILSTICLLSLINLSFSVMASSVIMIVINAVATISFTIIYLSYIAYTKLRGKDGTTKKTNNNNNKRN